MKKMKYENRVNLYRSIEGTSVSMRCPYCSEIGVFEATVGDLFNNENHQIFGIRRCPNSNCKGLVFVIGDYDTKALFQSFPHLTIPFDKSNIPTRIINSFEEAIICHGNKCFIASAIMIRKTLEEIADDKNIKANNLYERLKQLGSIIVIPKDLVEAMNELRLLGNDAAHIDAKSFEQIGVEEVEISIEFTKEILKATYQYEGLLARLRSLKKSDN